jgi:glucose 1-dehydrogenase
MDKTGNGKVVLVTGASRGIGTGIALVMAKTGYDIAITYTEQKTKAEEVAAQIRQMGRRVTIIQGDLLKEEVPAQIVEQCIKEMGHIDVLVNNAGQTIIGHILDMKLDQINSLLNLDFRSYVLMTQLVARHMRDQGIKGSIINITSTRGDRAYCCDGVYGGVKAALSRATQSFALDLGAFGIRVNCVAPGAIPTPATLEDKRMKIQYDDFAQRIPLKRFGTSEDIGNAVAWLASDQSSYITGQTLNVDGGLIIPGMPEVDWGNPPKYKPQPWA